MSGDRGSGVAAANTWLVKRLLPALGLVALLAGCGGSTATTTPVGQTLTAPPPTGIQTEPTTTAQAAPTTTGQAAPLRPPAALTVFFLHDGKVSSVPRTTDSTLAVGAAALRLLAEGPTAAEQAEGLASEIPRDAAFQLQIENGTATVVGPPGISDAASAQVVYTLTQFPTVRTVRINGGNAGDRSDWEELTPPILVLTPSRDQNVHSPARVAGTANTFEATLQLELQDGAGRVLVRRVVTATSGSGTRGTFEAELPFGDYSGPGRLVAYEDSAEDGSRIHVVEIPLTLGPSP